MCMRLTDFDNMFKSDYICKLVSSSFPFVPVPLITLWQHCTCWQLANCLHEIVILPRRHCIQGEWAASPVQSSAVRSNWWCQRELGPWCSSTAPHCTALHYTALHCQTLHCTARHCKRVFISSQFLPSSLLSGLVWVCSIFQAHQFNLEYFIQSYTYHIESHI
jgi:hypothetical protein